MEVETIALQLWTDLSETHRGCLAQTLLPFLWYIKHTLQEPVDHVRPRRTREVSNIVTGDFFFFFLKTHSEKLLHDGKHEEVLLLPYSHSVSASSQLTGYFFRGKGSVNLLAYIWGAFTTYIFVLYITTWERPRENYSSKSSWGDSHRPIHFFPWWFCMVCKDLFTAHSQSFI